MRRIWSKTQLGTYIGNHIFCLGPLANTSQCQPLPNKHPGLTAMSKCGKTLLDIRLKSRLRHRPMQYRNVLYNLRLNNSIETCL